jgi:hypothetical protein
VKGKEMIEQKAISLSMEYELILRRADDYFLKRIEPVGECMIWHGPFKQEVTHRKPVIRKSVPTNQTRSASRYAWELLYPELPEHRKLRYTCGNDLCVAPEHQEIIQDTCPKGHEMTESNKYLCKLTNGFTTYTCRVCVTDAQKAKRKAKKTN